MLSYVPKSGLNARGTKAHVDRASKWRWKRAWHPKSDSRREPDPQNSNDVARSPECRFWGCPKAEHNMWNWHILKLLWEQAKVGSNVLGVRTTRKGSNVKPCPPTLSVASPEVIPIALEIISIASPLAEPVLCNLGTGVRKDSLPNIAVMLSFWETQRQRYKYGLNPSRK